MALVALALFFTLVGFILIFVHASGYVEVGPSFELKFVGIYFLEFYRMCCNNNFLWLYISDICILNARRRGDDVGNDILLFRYVIIQCMLKQRKCKGAVVQILELIMTSPMN